MSEQIIICPPKEQLLFVEEVYSCKEEGCCSVFKNVSNLRMHLAQHHKIGILRKEDLNKDAKYACPVENCLYNIKSQKKKWFSNIRALKQHYMKVHAEKRHVCTKCKAKFSILSSFQRHLKICGAKFVCGVCGWQYNSNESLMVHLLRKHPEQHKEYIKNKKCDRIEEYITSPTFSNKYNQENPDLLERVCFNLETNELLNCIDDPNHIDTSDIIMIDCNNLNISKKVNNQDSVVLNNERNKIIDMEPDHSKTQNVNKDCFTQTNVKTVRKSSHSKIKKLNAETQTLMSQEKLLKQGKRLNNCTTTSNFIKKCFRTFGTQTFIEILEVPAESDAKIVEKSTINIDLDDSQGNELNNDSYMTECVSSTLSQKSSLRKDNLGTENHVNIETQTALDELLYSKLIKENDLEEDSTLFSELICLSDIQTQTAWPMNETLDKTCHTTFNTGSPYMFSDPLYDFPDCKIDSISTETQTCPFLVFNDDNSSFNIGSSYFKDNDCEYFSSNFLDRNKVLKSDIFFACESQRSQEKCVGNDVHKPEQQIKKSQY